MNEFDPPIPDDPELAYVKPDDPDVPELPVEPDDPDVPEDPELA